MHGSTQKLLTCAYIVCNTIQSEYVVCRRHVWTAFVDGVDDNVYS